jgi:hypothetical protein
MNTKRWEIVVSIAVLIVGSALVIRHANAPDGYVSSLQNDKIVATKVQNHEDGQKLTVDLSYPQYSGLSNVAAEIAINKDIKKTVNSIIDDAKSNADDEPSAISGADKSTISIDYKPLDPINDMVSSVLLISDYAAGSAHPNNYAETTVYDVKDGSIILLKKLFKDDADYLKILSDISSKKIVEKFPGNAKDLKSWIEEGAAPKEENFKEWYPTKDGLVIVFNPYQVAPYVYGEIEITINWDQLKDILK